MFNSFGINPRDEYLAQAFSMNIGLFTDQEQEKLARSKIAIPGMGREGGRTSYNHDKNRYWQILNC